MLEGWAGEEQRVALTLYTDAYVIRGSLATRQHRLSDILNFADEDFLVVADATFERFGQRGPARQAAYAQVNLSAVLFAVADRTVEAVPELRTPKVSETALISIPPFEIIGRIHLLPDRNLREALQELIGRFVPITDTTYWSDAAGEAARTAPMLAINHARAQILSPYETPGGAPSGAVSGEAWTGDDSPGDDSPGDDSTADVAGRGPLGGTAVGEG